LFESDDLFWYFTDTPKLPRQLLAGGTSKLKSYLQIKTSRRITGTWFHMNTKRTRYQAHCSTSRKTAIATIDLSKFDTTLQNHPKSNVPIMLRDSAVCNHILAL